MRSETCYKNDKYQNGHFGSPSPNAHDSSPFVFDSEGKLDWKLARWEYTTRRVPQYRTKFSPQFHFQLGCCQTILSGNNSYQDRMIPKNRQFRIIGAILSQAANKIQ
jgi:hypothetical protein